METGNLLIDAQTAFARQRRRRRWGRASAWLRRAPETSRLCALAEALGALPPSSRRRAGLEAISLESIVGTAEPAKARVFDNCFRVPESSRRRWERLWIASRRGAALPPIAVFRLDGEHFVDDGHHRVSVAHALGMVSIDAEVIELAA
ncbi:MAG: hypothetical protein QOE60_555 [Thermoleophilaceae bacterium]|nr:hypothetical protein [Thermoleophilaceae bacterium]